MVLQRGYGMSAVLYSIARLPLLQDLEALYQRVYGTPERMRKTDRFLACIIIAMSIINVMYSTATFSTCGVGA